ncbi:aspartate kinase [candidate division KSB1 bacterium]|nr:aspartate kinase [bacterium]OQX59258.1 MAG: aspartate kinase [candidate division KSB1 bacterium 4484_219]RKY75795.1 MAG: aspartate kinase [candidate division KSB1 bacterium]HDI51588.1 aspartate kinase [Bacteroidota bacterium]RKY77352.1 MAG: aspartate kinase [candidate division KSB1 bacterium]
MKVLVQKYGGSSVATPERIRAVAQRVAKSLNGEYKVVVVLSAMGDTTDRLLKMAYQITPNPSSRELDMLLSTGEQVSIALFCMALESLGISAVSLTGAQVGIITDSAHTKAKIMEIDTRRLQQELQQHQVVAVAGFQGINVRGDIVTLGRGGSDTTAVALAAVLEAEKCEIYTDVDGVYTADPHLVPNAKKLERISYDEMLELASLGSKVMQARAVECGKKYGVKIIVRSSFKENSGTIICEEDPSMEKEFIRGIAHNTSEAKITIRNVPDQPGIAAKIFGILAEANIVVDMIIQDVSEHGTTNISFTVEKTDLPQALKLAEKVSQEINAKGVSADKNIAKVSIVGIGMRSNAGVAAKMFQTLSEENINIQMISTSEIKISCVIEENAVQRAVQALHRKFELDKESIENEL